MIDNKSIQRELAARKLYTGTIDGIIGRGSREGMRQALLYAMAAGRVKRDPAAWPDDRVRIAFEQLMMSDLKIDAGAIDGFEGVSTQYGWEQWQNALRSNTLPPYLLTGTKIPIAGAPDWPKERDAETFYGKPGTNHQRIEPAYQLYYGPSAVKTITLNAKCADSAGRVFKAVLEHYGIDEIVRLKLDQYSGGFNDRAMRGGTRKSMHAYACALDFGAAWNSLRMDHKTALYAGAEYLAWWRAWEAEGWTSLGRARDFDWMHVQAADL